MCKKQLFILTLLFASMSCSKDNTTPSGPGSRAIKYEITGNYTGIITLVATTNNDNFEVIEISKLPWKLEFTAKSALTYVVVTGIGSGGIQGQTATLKTYVGGKEVKSGMGTALSLGVVSVTNETYLLK